jgi:hypothetical protein
LSNLYDRLSKSAFFIVICGLASIISLVVSFLNEKFILFSILTICLFTCLTLFELVNQNARMFRRLDDVNCDIFNQNIDIEYDEDKDIYICSSPIIIAMTSFLTPETASKKPTVLVEVDFPSELSLDFNYSTECISREEVSSNSAKFKVTLKSDTIIIAISSLSLNKEKETEFSKSSKKISVTFDSNLLLETKKENLLVSV